MEKTVDYRRFVFRNGKLNIYYYSKDDHIKYFLWRCYKNGVIISEQNKIATKNYNSMYVEFNDIGNIVSIKTMTSRCSSCANSNNTKIPAYVTFNGNNIISQRYSTACSMIKEEKFEID